MTGWDDGRLSDYVDVAERVVEFRQRHPDGRLRPAMADMFRVVEVGGRTFIAYAAAAYRDADDQLPGIGLAWEPFPGRTPYTRDSELQNAETAAWGRAIVACLAADARRGIATAQEVRNRRADDQAPSDTPTTPPLAGPQTLRDLGIAYTNVGITKRDERLEHAGSQVGRKLESSYELTDDEAKSITIDLRKLARDNATAPAEPSGGGSGDG